MANLNKVMLIGRLTREPEIRTFANGGKVANFGFAVNNRKKNPNSGEWESEPVFLDIKAFNRERGRQLADLVEQSLHKGNQVFLEGHLHLDQWTSQDGQKQSRLRIILDDLQFLEPRADGGMGEGGNRFPRAAGTGARQATSHSQGSGEYEEAASEPYTASAEPHREEEIPF
jgi:single-strand DNA-binding protein